SSATACCCTKSGGTKRPLTPRFRSRRPAIGSWKAFIASLFPCGTGERSCPPPGVRDGIWPMAFRPSPVFRNSWDVGGLAAILEERDFATGGIDALGAYLAESADYVHRQDTQRNVRSFVAALQGLLAQQPE